MFKTLIILACFVGIAFTAVSNDVDVWIHSTSQSALPLGAVYGGYDIDGSPLYVGRAYHNGNLIPAKVSPSKAFASVANYGKEHRKTTFDVLVGKGYRWVPDYNGHVPTDAVIGGKAQNGETFYVGRALYKNSLVIGKIHPSHTYLYIPFGGKEVALRQYEVLVR